MHVMAVNQAASSQVIVRNEVLCSAKWREIVDQVKACHLVKKDGALSI